MDDGAATTTNTTTTTVSACNLICSLHFLFFSPLFIRHASKHHQWLLSTLTCRLHTDLDINEMTSLTSTVMIILISVQSYFFFSHALYSIVWWWCWCWCLQLLTGNICCLAGSLGNTQAPPPQCRAPPVRHCSSRHMCGVRGGEGVKVVEGGNSY